MIGYEILTDQTKTGRERPWRGHKTASTYLSESFSRLKLMSKSDSVKWCGSSLKFKVCPSGHEKHLSWSNFCRIRLCPMCQWRRSLLLAHQIKLVAHESVKRQNLRWLFLTLTVKNSSGEDLSASIDHLMSAWDKLSRRKHFKKVIGWFRSLEVTRNLDDGTYHPHFHVLLGVAPSYFKDGYITQGEWSDIWQSCLDVDYRPIVDIRVVKSKNNNTGVQSLKERGIEIGSDGIVQESISGSVVAELAKYSTKSDDFLVYNKYSAVKLRNKKKLIPDLNSGINEVETDKVVSILDRSLARRRLQAFGGLLKEVWKELQLQGKVSDADDEQADLIHVDDTASCKCSVCSSDMIEELYSWIPGVRHYIKKENDSDVPTGTTNSFSHR